MLAQADLSYQLLLHPVDAGAVSLLERHAVAAFVAWLHDQPETCEHYRAPLERSDAEGIAAAVFREAEAARASGPCRARLVDKSRAKSEYLMLLAHDSEVLGVRTRTDKDIFDNTKGGLPRAERELAAAAVSRLNGCIFCAWVHARFAIHPLKRADDVNVLLEEGLPSPRRGRNGAVVAPAAALSQTPPGFSAANAVSLLDSGFDVQEQLDLVLSAAFFNWANRLMLSIGEPTPAAA